MHYTIAHTLIQIHQDQHVEDVRTFDPKAFAWGSIWKEFQRKKSGKDADDSGLTNSQMWAIWGETASIHSTAMAGMTKQDKSGRVSESYHKVRWWDMDKNQLYRDWNNAYEEATRALDQVGGTSTTRSAQKASIAAVTVGMSWEKVQAAHVLCMNRGEDRRTDFILNEYESRWRRKHKSKLECWEDCVKRVEFEKNAQAIFALSAPASNTPVPLTVMHDEGHDVHAEPKWVGGWVSECVSEVRGGGDDTWVWCGWEGMSGCADVCMLTYVCMTVCADTPPSPPTYTPPSPPLFHARSVDTTERLAERTEPQRDDDLPPTDLPKMSVIHMPVQRMRLGQGWVPVLDEVTYNLSYYDHDQRLSIQTHVKSLEQAKKRGGLTQFFWDLDLVWRLWTSTPRGTKDDNIVVHIVFAATPLMRERLYQGKQMYATVRSVGGIPTSPLTLTRSYVMIEASVHLCEPPFV